VTVDPRGLHDADPGSLVRPGPLVEILLPQRKHLRYGSEFGTSSRGSYSRGGFFDGEFDSGWDRPRDTYRTVCVRTCDGYYFPISFSVTSDRFERDRQACENSCGAQGRLFVYRNPGGDVEDMQDLQGKPYRQLRTAFLYRTEYCGRLASARRIPGSSRPGISIRVVCARTPAKRKGDKTAAAELARLESDMRGTTPLGRVRPRRRAGRTARQPMRNRSGSRSGGALRVMGQVSAD
jgi:hypothetical protein